MNVSIVASLDPKNASQYCGVFTVQLTNGDLGANPGHGGGQSCGFLLIVDITGPQNRTLHYLLSFPANGGEYRIDGQMDAPANQQSSVTANAAGFRFNGFGPDVGSVVEKIQWDGIAGSGTYTVSFSLPISQLPTPPSNVSIKGTIS